MSPQPVRFVGLGPGEADLVTVRAARHLASATLVLGALELWPRLQELAPSSRLEAPPENPIDEARAIASARANGERVCRAYDGDPMVSSRAARVLEALSGLGVDVTVVPGLVADLDVSSRYGIPFLRPSDPTPSYAVAEVGPDHLGTFEWEKVANATDTLVLDLAFADVAEVARTLTFHGRPGHTHALCLTAGPKAERPWTGTLDALAREFAARPRTKARLVVGPGARHAASFRKRLPLADKRVLVTRARAQADALAGLLRDEGAEPVFFPVLDFDTSDDPVRLRKACDDLASGTYRAVLFTSQNGVTAFVGALRDSGRDVRAFGKALVGAVGPATAASLERVGIKADFVAKEHLGEGLAEDALAVLGPVSGPGSERGSRVLLPRAKVARDVLPNALASAGFEVDVVTAYVTRSAESSEGSRKALVDKLLGGEIDVVTLTSSSTAMRLVEMLGPEANACLARALVASIGPVATKTAESLGVAVGVTAVTHTAEGLVGALRGHLCAHLDGVRR